MGEYAEQYTMEHFGVDISESERKPKWKWACPTCGKNLSSEAAQKQHMRDKHAVRASNKGEV